MDILKDMLVNEAVYWPPTGTNDTGNPIYGEPEARACRWEEKSEIFLSPMKTEELSKAVVYLDNDVILDGVLWFGSLAEVTNTTDPFEQKKAQTIRQFFKISTLDGTEFLRIAYL